jgi:hypothetical protein
MSKLFVYRLKTGRVKRNIGKFLEMSTGWDGKFTHGYWVEDVSQATIFKKGQYPKKDLPRNGRDYELVEVTVSIVENV